MFAVVGGVVVAVDCGKKLLHFVLTLNLILDTENRFFVSSYVHIYICMYIYVCILLIPSISQWQEQLQQQLREAQLFSNVFRCCNFFFRLHTCRTCISTFINYSKEMATGIETGETEELLMVKAQRVLRGFCGVKTALRRRNFKKLSIFCIRARL